VIEFNSDWKETTSSRIQVEPRTVVQVFVDNISYPRGVGRMFGKKHLCIFIPFQGLNQSRPLWGRISVSKEVIGMVVGSWAKRTFSKEALSFALSLASLFLVLALLIYWVHMALQNQ
jgi:hypothetical protein